MSYISIVVFRTFCDVNDTMLFELETIRGFVLAVICSKVSVLYVRIIRSDLGRPWIAGNESIGLLMMIGRQVGV